MNMNIKQNKEIWKEIKDFPCYFVSDQGRVKTIKYKKEKILSSTDNGNGYKRLYLYKNGIRYKFFIHRLVAFMFHKPRYLYNPLTQTYILKDQVHHIDHDKSNNCSVNLMYVTAKENMNYMFKHYKKI